MAGVKSRGRVKTRESVQSGLFGAPCELKDLQLPTYADIMRHYYWLRRDMDGSRDTYLQPVDDLVKMVGEKVTEIWMKASIPVVSKRTINGKIKDYYTKCRSVEKSLGHTDLKQQKNREEFVRKGETSLFDIAACKCRDLDNCICEKAVKVPHREIKFLQDQRTVRKMSIGNIDLKTSNVLAKTVTRKIKRDASVTKNSSSAPSSGVRSRPKLQTTVEDSSGESFEVTSSTESEFEAGPSKPNTSKRIPLTHTASAVFRTGVSDRQAALIASSVLQDAGIVTSEDSELVVDKNKLRREKRKLGKKIQEEEDLEGKKIKSIFFMAEETKLSSLK